MKILKIKIYEYIGKPKHKFNMVTSTKHLTKKQLKESIELLQVCLDCENYIKE